MDLKHSLDDARRAKQLVLEHLAGVAGIAGVGIGLNSSRDDYAVHVYVTEERARPKIRMPVDGIEVMVDVVGEIRAN